MDIVGIDVRSNVVLPWYELTGEAPGPGAYLQHPVSHEGPQRAAQPEIETGRSFQFNQVRPSIFVFLVQVIDEPEPQHCQKSEKPVSGPYLLALLVSPGNISHRRLEYARSPLGQFEYNLHFKPEVVTSKRY